MKHAVEKTSATDRARAAAEPRRIPRASEGVKPSNGGRTRTEAPPADGASIALGLVIGTNLRRLRVKRGLSLERLSRRCGVSRAMLGQVELGRSTPTIKVVWKIARALDVSFSTLITDPGSVQPAVLRADGATVLVSAGGAFVSRALFPVDRPRPVEFYELRLAPTSIERAVPHPPGTKETLVVADGCVTIAVGKARHHLATGDSIVFEADVPHEYANDGPEAARMYLVMTYPERR